jgi:hypothetical protein
MTPRLMSYLPVSNVTSQKVRTTGYLGGLVKILLTTLISLKSFPGLQVNVNLFFIK